MLRNTFRFGRDELRHNGIHRRIRGKCRMWHCSTNWICSCSEFVGASFACVLCDRRRGIAFYMTSSRECWHCRCVSANIDVQPFLPILEWHSRYSNWENLREWPNYLIPYFRRTNIQKRTQNICQCIFAHLFIDIAIIVMRQMHRPIVHAPQVGCNLWECVQRHPTCLHCTRAR